MNINYTKKEWLGNVSYNFVITGEIDGYFRNKIENHISFESPAQSFMPAMIKLNIITDCDLTNEYNGLTQFDLDCNREMVEYLISK